MYSKAVKEEVAIVLKRLLKQKTFEDVQFEIDEISDEYRIDLTEPEPEDEEAMFNEHDQYLEEDEVEDIFETGNWDDDEEY